MDAPDLDKDHEWYQDISGEWKVRLKEPVDPTKCCCGVDSVMPENGRHSDYCPKYKKAPDTDFDDAWRQNK